MTQVVVQRVLYGILAIIVLVTLFVLDAAIAARAASLDGAFGRLLQHGSLVPLLFVTTLTCGAVELRRLLRAKGARPHTVFAHLMIVVILLTPWLASAGWLGSRRESATEADLYWQTAWLMVTVVGTGVLTVFRRVPGGTFRDMGATFIMVFYLGFLGSFGVKLRCAPGVAGQEGVWLLLIVVLVTKASDIGGFFAGSTLGRHKLAATISPAKSIEGTVGGAVMSIMLATLVATGPSLAATMDLGGEVRGVVERFTQSLSTRPEPGAMSPLWRGFFFGLAMSLAGQMGDLIESCFKRDAGSKDSGEIIPRFGGILDLVDSPVLAMPVAWFLLVVVWGAF